MRVLGFLQGRLLTWHEARLARSEQQAFFMSEKAPSVSFKSATIQRNVIFLEFTNVGESAATQIVAMASIWHRGIEISLPLRSNLDILRFDMRKGGTQLLDFLSLDEVEKLIGWRPSALILVDVKSASQDDIPSVHLSLNFKDVLGRSYFEYFKLELRRELPGG